MPQHPVWHGTVQSAGAPLAGVLVSDGCAVVRTDPAGRFDVPADPAARFLVLTVPSGYESERWYVPLAGRDQTQPVDFACNAAPERGAGAFTVIHVTDIHVSVDHADSGERIGDDLGVMKYSTGKRGRASLTREEDLAADLQRIAATETDALAFFITGDLANSGQRAEHEAFARAIQAPHIPVRCIPGNHDYMDTRALEKNYEAVLGPRYYSFDLGAVHFLAIDWWEMDQYPDRAERQHTWVAREMAMQSAETPIVVLSHDQLPEHLLAPFRGHRLIATFSGHRHATRVYDDGHTVHYNTPTLMFGAYDHSPRCYRVLRFDGARVTVETKTLHDDPACVRVAFSAAPADAATSGGAASPVRLNGEWPQFHGGAGRGGLAADGIAPPLHVAWRAALGDSLNLGGPAVAGGLVVVGLQREDAPGGALLALDAVTGQERWRIPVANSIKRTPAVSHGMVIACTVSGEVIGADLESGEVRWRYQIGDPSLCWIFTAPVVTDGVVCVGEAFHFAALDVQTGEPRWVRTDFGEQAEFINMSSPAAADGTVFASFFWQQQNFAALDVTTGETRWAHTEGHRRAAVCGAAVVGGRVYVSRVTTHLECLDAASGDLHWRTTLGAIFNQATPCVAADRVYAVSGLGAVRALDAATGATCWTWQAGDAVLETAPYMRRSPNTIGSPVLAGGHLYVPSNCGRLTALDADSGALVWDHDFGVPLPGSPAASGNTLFIPAANGTITAMTAA